MYINLLILLSFIHYVLSSSRQQKIFIQGRDPYIGYVSEFIYDTPQCISSLRIIAQQSLTGAEEIDLLYSECKHDKLHLAHYRNDESLFSFGESLMVSRILLVSHRRIHIDGLHLIQCLETTTKECIYTKDNKKRRRHSKRKSIRIQNNITRRKRETLSQVFTVEGSPYTIDWNITIPYGESITVNHGTKMFFTPGVGIDVYGSIQMNGTDQDPIYLSSTQGYWRGIHFYPGYDASHSSLQYINISSSTIGIEIDEGTEPPLLHQVVVDSSIRGIVLKTQKGDGLHRITKTTVTNSVESGFLIRGEGDVQLEECISSSNGHHGIQLINTGSISIFSSSSFSNHMDGLNVNETNSLFIQESLVGGNGAAGLRIIRPSSTSNRLIVHLKSVSITAHFYDPSILLSSADNIDFLISDSNIYENTNGALIFGGTTSLSEIRLINNRWIKNVGPTVHFGLVKGGSFLVEGNIFDENRGKQQREASLEVMTDTDDDTTIVINNNTWNNNQLEGIIRFELMGGREPKTTISRNVLSSNKATVVVDLSSLKEVTVEQNQFNNPESSCELASVYDHTDNSFLSESQNNRCYLRVGSTSRPLITSSTLNIFPPLTETYNEIKTKSSPYIVEKDIDIPSDTIVVVDKGNAIGFYGDVGMNIQGKLYINGTREEPIELFGGDGSPWKGLNLEKGGHLFLSNVIIRDPRIGLLLNSDSVTIHNVSFIRSIDHAIQIKPSYCPVEQCTLDLGNSTIRDSFGTSLIVDRRDNSSPMTLSNGRFIDNADTAIEFHAPSGEISIKDVQVKNGGGNAVWLEERGDDGMDSVTIERLKIEDAERGEVGLYISSRKAKKVEIVDSSFERNTVPSAVIDLDLNASSAFFNFTGNKFINNTNVVSAISCVGCSSGQLSSNEWIDNNGDHDGSALFVEFKRTNEQKKDPSILISTNKFEGNNGESTMAFSSDPSKTISGLLYQNLFIHNNNSRAVIITDTPDTSMTLNTLENPLSMFDMEVMFKDEGKQMNATKNKWTSNPPEILDGNQSKFKGFVNLGSIPLSTSFPTIPTIITPISPDCATVNYCSGHGKCIGPSLCLCNSGWTSSTCSVKTSSCPLDCSGNGACIGSQCICELGWIGQSCETATCTGVNDCYGNGVCVGKDKCECADGWTGPNCGRSSCTQSSCQHGKCTDDKCICDSGWSGPSCTFPLCSSNCSLNGICSSPDTCQCFPDFSGQNCEECISNSCKVCDVPCVNGICDSSGQVCICDEGWSGSSCDMCSSSSICSIRSAILFLLPPTADPSIPGQIINVHVSQLPRSSGRYSCVYGSISSIGQQVSSSLVRCPLPSSLPQGRHIFNLWPEKAATPIPYIDKRPIHFTSYSTCVPSICKGDCLGPICICPRGKSGPLCQFALVTPSIDKQFISDASTTTATEDQPYIVQLPSQANSVLRIETDAPDLRLDESRSLLIWESPQGRAKPYNVTVVMSTLGGDSTFSWNLSVPVAYSTVIDKVNKDNRSRRYLIEGRVVGTEKKKDVPVVVTFVRSDNMNESREVLSDMNGRFIVHWTPPPGNGQFNVISTHPGEEFDEKTKGISVSVDGISIEYPKEIGSDQLIKGIDYKINNDKEKGDWTIEVIYPIEDIIVDNKKMITNGSISVNYRLKKKFNGNFVVLFTKGDDKLIANHKLRSDMSSTEPDLLSYPSSILFHLNEQSKTEPIKIDIYTNGFSFTSPLSMAFSTSPPPFTLLSSTPSINQYSKYTNSSSPIILWLQPTGEGPVSGTLSILYRTDTILRIPYSIRMSSSPFILRICLKDRSSTQSPSTSTDAEMTLTRVINNAVTVRQATINGSPEEFEIVSGYYYLSITSYDHEDRKELIWVSPSNNSFCTELTPIHREILPVWNGEEILIDVTAKNTDSSMPLLLFTPSSLSTGDHEIEVEVIAPSNTILSLLPPDNQYIQMISSDDRLLENGDIIRMNVHVSSINSDCDGIIIPFPFVYQREEGSFRGQSPIIILNQEQSTKGPPRICSSSSSSPLPLSYSTQVQCDCSSGVRSKCREKYRGVAACGDSWIIIPDDTISTEVLALFVSLISNCKSMGIEMDEIHEATQCISSLESVCPLNRKVGVVPITANGAMFSSNLDTPPVAVLLPVLRALDLQSVALSTVYNEFFDKLEIVFPSSNFSKMSMDDFSAFFNSISDTSEIQQWISNSESSSIKNGDAFVSRWNSTMNEWRSGKISPFHKSNNESIQFSDAKQLIVAADRLKSLARQQGSSNPFSLLHDYVGRVLSSLGDSSGIICAESYVFISSNEVEEDQQFTVRVNVHNMRMNSALDNVELTLDLVRDDPYQPLLQFRIGPFIYTGIRSLGGTTSLGPSQSFEATWTVLPLSDSRLTKMAHYQAIISLSFTVGGRSTLVRLNSPRVTVVPRKSMRILYFLPPSNTTQSTLTTMVSLVNTGYRPLEGVRIEGVDISVLDSKGAPSAFSIDTVSTKDSIDKDEMSREGILGDVPSIQTGHSTLMPIQMTLQQGGKLESLKVTPSMNGEYLKMDDSKSFTMITQPKDNDYSNGFLISPQGQNVPLFYFTPKDSKIQNIANLKLIQNRWDSSTSNEKTFIRVQAIMENSESPDFASTLWGKIKLPTIPENYRLLKVREIGNADGPNGRGVGGETWIDDVNGDKVLNFIDSGSIGRGNNINYEFIFGDPHDFVQPIFAQDVYRIQVLPEFWPKKGSIVGEIRANSPMNYPISYSLYSKNNDDTWAVIPSTGQIVLQSQLRRGEESCLTLVAEDSEGGKTSVPVAINTGTASLKCPLITDSTNLTSLEWIPTTSSPSISPTMTTHAPPTSPTVPTRITVPTTISPTRSTAPATIIVPTTISYSVSPTIHPVTQSIVSSTTNRGSTIVPIIPTFPVGPSSGTTENPWTTIDEFSVPSITPDIDLSTITPIVTQSTSESINIHTTNIWDDFSTTNEHFFTSFTQPTHGSIEQSTVSSTTEFIHTINPDVSPVTTVIIPWVTTSSGEESTQWFTSIFPSPSPLSTSDYHEYSTESPIVTTEETIESTVIYSHSPEATLPTLPPITESSTEFGEETTQSITTFEPSPSPLSTSDYHEYSTENPFETTESSTVIYSHSPEATLRTLPPTTPSTTEWIEETTDWIDQTTEWFPSPSPFPTSDYHEYSTENTVETTEPSIESTVIYSHTPVPTLPTVIPTVSFTTESTDETTQSFTTISPSPLSTSDYNEYTTDNPIDTTESTVIYTHTAIPSLPTVLPSEEPNTLDPFTSPSVLSTISTIHTAFPDSTLSSIPSESSSVFPSSTFSPLSPFPPIGSIPSVLSSSTPSITSFPTEYPFTLVTIPTTGEENHSSTTRGLSVEACRLKGTAPIWGVICDLSKTLKSV